MGKILFLDIDGVLNYAMCKYKIGGMLGIDPAKAELVRRIVADTGCEVVLSSTWRLDAKSRAHVRQKVVKFIDITKSIGIGWRGEEVKEWLQRHPDVERYAILDDDRDFYDDQPLFRTNFYGNGLTEEIAAEVIEYLNKV